MSDSFTTLLPISVIIIAKNEEHRIGDCIDSVRSLTNDIVVVDSGSTDHTREVALAHGARVAYHEWQGYSQQKNFGNYLAKYNWILSLDADERVSSKLAGSIREAFAAGPLHDAYTLRFRSFFEGKPVRFGAWNPEFHIRLFDRLKFTWNCDDVHEGLRGEDNTAIGRLDGVVLHFTIEERAQLARKTDLYASLFAQKARRKNKSVSWAKVWLNPAWRFFRDYVVRLGLLDGTAGWSIAFEAARYTHLKYNRIGNTSASRRTLIWFRLAGAVTAIALAANTALLPHAVSKLALAQQIRVEKYEPIASPTLRQFVAVDDNYEDAGVVLPGDDDGVA
jgi:glycosyltransferase involved in cell wall biosynthesis